MAKSLLKSNTLPSFSAVIFDMDGLVLDTESTYAKAWIKAAEEMGYHFSEMFCLSMSGLHAEEVKQRLLDKCGIHFELKKFFSLSGVHWRNDVEKHGIAVKKGFFNIINVLKNRKIPFCLATNSKHVNALECLQLANISDVFSLIVARDHVDKGKPAPDIFFAAAGLLNHPIASCLVIEDSTVGITAAIEAGAHSVFIPSIFPCESTTVRLADCYMNDLVELAECVEAMNEL